jgi:isopenicillin N synthase-like dioxygenase
MRLFVYIHETGKDITVWFPDHTTVLTAKQAILQSKQTSIFTCVEDMELYCCSSNSNNGSCVMKDTQVLEYYAPATHKIQVHALLLPKEVPLASRMNCKLADNFVVYHTPSDGAANVSVTKPGVICLYTTQSVYHQLKALCEAHCECLQDLIMVRDSRNQRVFGSLEFEASPHAHMIRFVSAQMLLSNGSYSVLVDGRMKDPATGEAVWIGGLPSKRLLFSFKTQKLSELQLFVRVHNVTKSHLETDTAMAIDPDSASSAPIHSQLVESCVLTLGRQSLALFDEFQYRLASVLSIQVFHMIGVRAQHIDGSIVSVHSDHDIGVLNNSDSIEVDVDLSAVDKRENGDMQIPTCVPITGEQWAQYNRDNWVNDASGYLAVCGKFESVEEEMELILNVVRAFEHNEDNKDGIGSNNGVDDSFMPTTATAVNDSSVQIADAVYVAPTDNNHSSSSNSNNRSIMSDCGCAIDSNSYPAANTDNSSTAISTNQRAHGTVPLSTQAALHSSLADATVPDDMRAKLWSDEHRPHVFQLNWNAATSTHSFVPNDGGDGCLQRESDENNMCSMIQTLKTHGYAIVQLPTEVAHTLTHLHATAKRFFNENDLREKEHFKSNFFRYIGYVNNPHYKKELFQMRMYSEEHTRLDSEVWRHMGSEATANERNTEFKQSVYTSYQMLSRLTSSLTADILMNGQLSAHIPKEDMAVDRQQSRDYVQSLFETSVPDAAYRHQLSLSNLSVFQYNAPENGYLTDIHCPCHSDITLLTIIPLFGESSGLHMYDWSVNKWMDVCTNISAYAATNGPAANTNTLACVFTGEMMARMTANYLLPAMHEVSNIGPGPRISTPFQCCARSGAMIEPRKIPLALVTNKRSSLDMAMDVAAGDEAETTSIWQSCNAGDFVQMISQSRVSSNFINMSAN